MLVSLARHVKHVPSNKRFQYLDTIWAQPKYAMVDLCHRINAADVTISHNTDNLLNPNYTEHSCGRYTRGSHSPCGGVNDYLYRLLKS